jgi:hypothetical protein
MMSGRIRPRFWLNTLGLEFHLRALYLSSFILSSLAIYYMNTDLECSYN